MAENQRTTTILQKYLRALNDARASGLATEHTYRPALKALIESLGRGTVVALNEPSQVDCGAPDFIIQRDGIPLGHFECKDIGVDMGSASESEQILRYRNGLPNLILTDYLEFRWYVEGELRKSARLGRPSERGEITLDGDGGREMEDMIASFFEVYPPTITNAGDLAQRMAAKASLLREAISLALDQEGVSGPLSDLLEAYRRVLIEDLSSDDFADMQAQTAAYGLFAARCGYDRASRGPFTRQSAVFADTTPFLRDVFGRIAGPDIDPRIAWIVDDLARLLDCADMGAILSGFGGRGAREDPVVHFYEDFLAAYDPALREMRGVYYTPDPVVSYIVRSVDALLRRSFSLRDGLADTERITVDVGVGGKKEIHRVLILDPAAGTGTFLREVVANIRQNIVDQGTAGSWPSYVQQHLLPRLFGFEILMAAYAMCHLKLTLEIAGPEAEFAARPKQGRLNIFLTNSLDGPRNANGDRSFPMMGFAREIAREAAEADAVKRHKPVMVILGNPPYSGHSANKGKWIASLLRGDDGERGTGSYFHIDGEPLGERNPKWLNDDYVKFIRFAQWRIERTGEGILGFVTNHSYLDAPTFRGMRRSLMDDFDEIYVLDLHGNVKKRERTPDGGKDENVFDIQQGVAIGLFVKHGEGGDSPARVFHADLWGERGAGDDDGKYGWLAAKDVTTTDWTQLQPRAPLYLFVPRDEALADEYERGWRVTDIFPIGSSGIVTARDKMAIQWTRDQMHEVAINLNERSEGDVREIYHELVRDKPDWNLPGAQRDVHAHHPIDEYITPILYRPFDTRYTYYTGRGGGFICGARRGVMRHMLAGQNIALIVCRQQSQAGVEWSLCGVSRLIIESSAISNKTREINTLFPSYVYPEEEQWGEREPNLGQDFLDAAASALALDFVPDGPGDLSQSFGPEDVLHYVYAILHSPEYRRRYADFLRSDFPRVPLSSDRELFAAIVGHGRRLASLHLMESDGEGRASFPVEGTNRVDRVSYTPPMDGQTGRVYINRYQHFDGVDPKTWEFAVGGYRPCEKWLRDRKGRDLTHDDITHYRRLAAALAETIRIMPRIDAEIKSRGGWPVG